MKKPKLTLLFMLVALAGQAQTKNFIDQPYIEVSGSADTLVTPNEIYIRILLSERDTKDKIPLEELEGKMVGALQSLSINIEKDLATSDMTSNFKSYLFKSKDILKSKLYTLKVSDAVKATQVFIKLEELGISNTSIDRVDHSDLEGIRNTMRTKAIVNAKTRAAAMAKPLNQTIGAAIHIADAESVSNQLQGRTAGIMIRGAATIQNNLPDFAKIDFEKIKVSAAINAKFILK
jgi:uncharacterized protein